MNVCLLVRFAQSGNTYILDIQCWLFCVACIINQFCVIIGLFNRLNIKIDLRGKYGANKSIHIFCHLLCMMFSVPRTTNTIVLKQIQSIVVDSWFVRFDKRHILLWCVGEYASFIKGRWNYSTLDISCTIFSLLFQERGKNLRKKALYITN